ncbi:MAG: aminomethyl-transferring glycine dehydrogenase subunit GcvPA [candidate division WS1 bacterium]|nr:aminomethyl-transferring glycine dehydrogenase subunit GcvPA [candidate division WS1 bacterium]
MAWQPHSERDRREMLEALGAESVDALFADIPAGLRETAMPDLPAPLTEMELVARAADLAGQNASLDELTCFAGGGIYDHFIPAIVRNVISRPEFLTPYTPYQPEASQGTLQAIFEYQTMICELTGMHSANASLYDGATALGEAVLLAADVTHRKRVVIAGALSPVARQAAETYCSAGGIEIALAPWDDATGQTDLAALAEMLDDSVACVALQQPNYFGVLEQMPEAASLAREAGALFTAMVEPTSLVLLKPPGEYDADLVVGEGQPLGLPPGYGGPLLGIFACREEYLRQMPGRVVGRTVDAAGETAYCLTLQTREQHIRRDRATSNICTNQGLCALAAAVYMAAMGPEGLREVALLGAERAHQLRDLLNAAGLEPRFGGAFLNEFVLRVPAQADAVVRELCAQGYLVGPSLARDFDELGDCLLLATTERRTVAEVEAVVDAMNALELEEK